MLCELSKLAAKKHSISASCHRDRLGVVKTVQSLVSTTTMREMVVVEDRDVLLPPPLTG